MLPYKWNPRQQQMDGLLPAVGGLIANGLSGHSSETDRSHELEQYGKGNDLADFATGVGKDATARGADYYAKILSGDPTAIAEATAPMTNAVAGQTDAQKRALASMGTSRGGGINDTLQQLSDRPITTSVDAITHLMPQAAQGETSIGAQQEGLGANIMAELMAQAAHDRQFDVGQANEQGAGIANLLTGF
jgi:hypothetical protein